MTDGQLLLVTGALLTAGLAAALLAGRVRVPGLLLFLGIGMAIGSDGTGWIRFNDYELARRVGIVALALILFEGGLTAGFSEIRPVLRPSLILAFARHVAHRDRSAGCGDVAVRLLHARGDAASARSSPRTDGAAIFADPARVDARAAAGAHARGRGRLQRPGRRPARARLHRLDPGARLRRSSTWSWLFVAEIGDRRAVGLVVGRAGRRGAARVRLATRRPVPGRLAGGRARSRSALADVAPRLGLPRRLPRRPGARHAPASPPSARSSRSTTGSPGWRRSAMFFMLGLLVFPRQLGDVAVEGTVLALVLVARRPAARAFVATRVRASRCAERSCSAGRACAARCPSCSRRSR